MTRMFFKKAGRGTAGQATLELSVALILSAMLLVAAAKIFVWLNGSMVVRQRMYEETRVSAGQQTENKLVDLGSTSVPSTVMSHESDYPTLNIVEEFLPSA